MSTKIWYNKYNTGYDKLDNQWMRAVPIGNGRVAAMVYGNPDCETIEVNEESLWSGEHVEEEIRLTREKLDQVRKLISERRFDEAEKVGREDISSIPCGIRFFESFGELMVDYYDKSPADNYYRELELSTAVSLVRFSKNTTNYSSETFISSRYDALIHRIEASNPFSCNITFKRSKDAYTAAINMNTVLMKGQVHFADDPMMGKGGEGLEFGARLYIDTDGECVVRDSSIDVVRARYITVIGAFSTDYNVNTFSKDENISWRRLADEIIEKAKNISYDEIKKAHIQDWQEKFNRVKFELDAQVPETTPTDYRLEALRYLSSIDPDIYTLYFNFGRYLMLSSSDFRATLPANLQGKWCHGFRPDWGSDYHLNINLQMNYWPCESANMSESFAPYTHMMKILSGFGKRVAKKVFDSDGWLTFLVTDVFGRVGNISGLVCGFFPASGAWNCLNLWEHYEYSADDDYLREIYPILKGCCIFFKDYLIEKDGYLITSPSNSPENEYYYINSQGEKKKTMLTEGATIDVQIIHSVFTHTLFAAKKLNDDKSFINVLDEVISKLPPLRVSQYGTVAEWICDNEEVEPGHRHLSHLYGLFPYHMINENDPVIYEAAKKTITRRLENGGGGTGWSRAWIVNLYARVHDGNNAFKNLDKLVREFTYYNMFDLHPPRPLFQIDGNFGGTSGIVEMLLQSHLGNPGERILELLPALPESWKKGSITGLRARGNFEVDIIWDDGLAVRSTIKAFCDNTLRVKLNERTASPICDMPSSVENGVLIVEMKNGDSVEIKFN